jgi:hypothetical protein
MWLKSQLQINKYEWHRFFLLEGGLDSNFNTMDLVNFFEKIKKRHIQIVAVTLKMTSWKNMSKRKEGKKVKNQDFMNKTNYFLSTMPFNPPAISATWLHVGAPQKIQEKWT